MGDAARAVVRTYRFGARGEYDSDDYDDEEEGVREVMRLVQGQNGRLIPASIRSTRAPPVPMRPVGTPRDSVSDARLEPYDTMVWKYSERSANDFHPRGTRSPRRIPTPSASASRRGSGRTLA